MNLGGSTLLVKDGSVLIVNQHLAQFLLVYCPELLSTLLFSLTNFINNIKHIISYNTFFYMIIKIKDPQNPNLIFVGFMSNNYNIDTI